MKAQLVFPQGAQIVDITPKFDEYLDISTRSRLEANPMWGRFEGLNDTQPLEQEWPNKTIAKGRYSSGYAKASQLSITLLLKYIHQNGPDGDVLSYKCNS